MRSVRNKIILTIILFSLLATLTTAVFSSVYIQNRIRENTFDYLTESAKYYGSEINTVIVSLESSVDALSRSIVGTIDESRINDPNYFYELSEKIEKIATQFDSNSINTMAFYVRFDPLISYSTAGFFHADTDDDGILEKQIPTDLLQYDPNDREHVGWFYEPMEAGKAIWMDPYYNANINIEMISYVSPIFIDGKPIGVVGLDVNFDKFKSIVGTASKIGKAQLLNSKYEFLVHDIFKPTDSLISIDNGKLKPLEDLFESKLNGTAAYKLLGVDKILGFSKLDNGWTVVVSMTEEEAFSSLNRTVDILILLNIFIGLLMAIIAYFVGKYLNKLVLRNSELEEIVLVRTQQLVETNEYLEVSMANLEQKQSELILVNKQLDNSMTQLQDAQEQLIISEKLASLGELVAGVAHEINTPLGTAVTLISFVNKQIEGVKDKFKGEILSKEELGEYLDSSLEASELCYRNLKRTAEIVETFKQLAIDQSTEDIRKINLNDYINKILMNLSPILKNTKHKIKVECKDSIEIITYPGVLVQIFTNLIVNSLIHGFEGIDQGEIFINIFREDDKIVLIYKDNGVGILPENLEKVFNPFFSTRHYKGSSGLGLHIIHNSVTRTLNGTVALYSTPQNGVEFRIMFKETPIDDKDL